MTFSPIKSLKSDQRETKLPETLGNEACGTLKDMELSDTLLNSRQKHIADVTFNVHLKYILNRPILVNVVTHKATAGHHSLTLVVIQHYASIFVKYDVIDLSQSVVLLQNLDLDSTCYLPYCHLLIIVHKNHELVKSLEDLGFVTRRKIVQQFSIW